LFSFLWSQSQVRLLLHVNSGTLCVTVLIFVVCLYTSSATAPGSLLASISSSPDYQLTVWDWREERMLLHTKAFSQDVYRVAFSPSDDGQIISSGTGAYC